jgi:hypothetical protein
MVTSASVTATLGASMATANITVSSATNLVINEVDYDSVGTDTTEFVEIYNPTGAAIDLTNVSLVLVNGATSTQYLALSLAPAGSLAPGGYLVVADSAAVVDAGAKRINFTTAQDSVQNGAPDGLALVDTSTHTVIDALSYEGSITAATITGITGTVSLVEGTALAAATADNSTTAASLARLPNGTDTNNASTDWKVTTTPTPGTANVP